MAILYAQHNGLWSTMAWNSPNSTIIPTPEDVVVSNGYIVIVDGNYTVLRVSNENGGTFDMAPNSSLTCTDTTTSVVNAAAGAAITVALGSGQLARLGATLQGGGAPGSHGAILSGAGTLEVSRPINGGAVPGAYGIYITSNAALSAPNGITGSVTGTNSDAIVEAPGVDSRIMFGSAASPSIFTDKSLALKNGTAVVNGSAVINAGRSVMVPNTATITINKVT